jgi:hypothetical protein
MAYKLGLLPHTPDERDIKLSTVYTVTTDLPSTFGATGLPWGMLGNNEYGDCYWASAAHEAMAENHLVGRTATFTTEPVLTSYAEYLGLKSLRELNERTDRGTDARKGAKFRRLDGVKDSDDVGVKINAWALTEDKDYHTILSAVHDFGSVTVCVELPESAEEAFNRAEEGEGEYVWDYVRGSQIAGGHAVAGVGSKDGQLQIVSWGHEVTMTEAFIEHYLQCAVVYVSGSVLNGEGKTINGLNRAALRSELIALG